MTLTHKSAMIMRPKMVTEWMTEIWLQTGAGNLSSCLDQLWDPQSLQWVPAIPFPRVKESYLKVDCSPLLNVESTKHKCLLPVHLYNVMFSHSTTLLVKIWFNYKRVMLFCKNSVSKHLSQWVRRTSLHPSTDYKVHYA
jgi:hypothetical protein